MEDQNKEKREEIIKKLKSNKASLKKYAFSLTRPNKEDAEDLFQDTILMILQKAHLYKEESYFKSWSATIMRNIFINKYRKKKVEQKYHVEEGIDTNIGLSNLHMKDLKDAIDTLRQDYKQVVLMRIVDGLKYAEISELLGISSAALRAMFFRAIRKLREEIEKKSID